MGTAVLCGDQKESCVCYEAFDHANEHVCRCGGSWTNDEDRVPITFPGGGSFLDMFDPLYVGRLAGAFPDPERVD